MLTTIKGKTLWKQASKKQPAKQQVKILPNVSCGWRSHYRTGLSAKLGCKAWNGVNYSKTQKTPTSFGVPSTSGIRAQTGTLEEVSRHAGSQSLITYQLSDLSFIRCNSQASLDLAALTLEPYSTDIRPQPSSRPRFWRMPIPPSKGNPGLHFSGVLHLIS